MQGEANSSHWLDIVESSTVVAAIGGSIAAAVLQEIALASIPLALTATLNLANRRRQLGGQFKSNNAWKCLILSVVVKMICNWS